MTNQKSTRRWHTNLLLALVAVWGVSSAVWIIWTLANAPAGMLGLIDYYVFLSVPILLIAAAYLLFAQSPLRVLPFALLPIAYVFAAIRLYPRATSPSSWTTLSGYLSQFPATLWGSAMFFALCAIYCLLLNKKSAVGDER